MEQFELPDGWVWRKLGEIFDFVGGGTPDKNEQDFWNGDIPWASVKDIKSKYLTKTIDFISREGLQNSASRLAEVGEIILITRITPGKTTIAKIQTAINQDLKILKPKTEVETLFAHYLFEAIENEIVKRSSGTTVLGIRLEVLKDIPIPLPPLPTQLALVARLEHLLGELSAGKSRLEQAAGQLKTYRQAVLKWAFEGKLTGEIVNDGELPQGWKWDFLGSFIESIEAGRSFKCDERPPKKNEIGIVKVSSVTWGEFQEKESKTILSDDQFNESYLIKEGDFLFSRANTIELVGACVIVKEINDKLMLSDKILRFKFSKELSKFYALYYLRTRNGRSQIESLSTGNQESMRNIGQQKIRQISIPVPPLSAQQKIIHALETRLTVCDELEKTITAALAQSETLRQSLLKRAFEGKLV